MKLGGSLMAEPRHSCVFRIHSPAHLYQQFYLKALMGSVAVSSFSTHWQMPRGLHHKVERNIFGEPVHPLIKGKGPRKETALFLASLLPLLPAWSEKMLGNAGDHPHNPENKKPHARIAEQEARRIWGPSWLSRQHPCNYLLPDFRLYGKNQNPIWVGNMGFC